MKYALNGHSTFPDSPCLEISSPPTALPRLDPATFPKGTPSLPDPAPSTPETGALPKATSGSATSSTPETDPSVFGAKHDRGKLPWMLLPLSCLRGAVRVLSFGARKYAPFSWRDVPHGRARYLDAAFRHLDAYQAGEEFDSDSGLPHIDHAIVNLIFARSDHWEPGTTLPDWKTYGEFLCKEQGSC